MKLDDARESALKAEHGKLIKVELDGCTLVFRRLKKAELVAFMKRGSKSPELAVEHCVGACRSVLVWPEDNCATFDRLADEYPLAFAGKDGDGVIDALVNAARGEVSIEAK